LTREDECQEDDVMDEEKFSIGEEMTLEEESGAEEKCTIGNEERLAEDDAKSNNKSLVQEIETNGDAEKGKIALKWKEASTKEECSIEEEESKVNAIQNEE